MAELPKPTGGFPLKLTPTGFYDLAVHARRAAGVALMLDHIGHPKPGLRATAGFERRLEVLLGLAPLPGWLALSAGPSNFQQFPNWWKLGPSIFHQFPQIFHQFSISFPPILN